MYSKGSKNTWALFLLILAGIVFGGFLGNTLSSLKYLEWISYGNDFGISSPLVLDLGVLVFQFGLLVRFNIGSIIGIVIAIFVYKKL